VIGNPWGAPAQPWTSSPGASVPGLAPRPPFTIRSQKNGRRTAQADDRVGCGPQTHTAPEKAKDSERADNQRNRAQYDARQAR
jgi:hypothetical protein